MNRFSFIVSAFLFLFSLTQISAQKIIAGPMKGYLAMKEAAIWLQTDKPSKVQIKYWDTKNPVKKLYTKIVETDKEMANTVQVALEDLEINTEYEFIILLNNVAVKPKYEQKLKTRDLWKYRKDAFDLSFVTGSCNYVNETKYDRPGTPYGGEHQIFEQMANRKPDFMIWLGDNTYLREPDWDSKSGILHRYTHTRQLPEMQKFLATTHHYAIWDDHDYGPNDSERSFYLKDVTLNVFKSFWANPNYGVGDSRGITGFFDWADCDFFLIDDRTFRSPKGDDGEILGQKQLSWFTESIKQSTAKFKFIAIGTQVLNSAVKVENLINYKKEYSSLIDTLDKYNISGVIFLTGDRHHSEVSKYTTADGDVFHDFTVSPLTSGIATAKGEINEYQVPGSLIEVRNFAEFKVLGDKNNRRVVVKFFDSAGKEIYQYEVK